MINLSMHVPEAEWLYTVRRSECPAEGAGIFKPTLPGNFLHRLTGVLQLLSGLLQPDADKVLIGGGAKYMFELSHQLRHRQAGRSADRIQVEVICIGRVQDVFYYTQAFVQFGFCAWFKRRYIVEQACIVAKCLYQVL